jgi:hypothetical protein
MVSVVSGQNVTNLLLHVIIVTVANVVFVDWRYHRNVLLEI